MSKAKKRKRKIRITSVAWEDVSQKLSVFTVPMQQKFQALFEPKYYGAGIEQFTVVAIADENDDKNS